MPSDTLTNDYNAIIKTSYRQLRRLIDIDALLSAAQILLTQLAAKPAQSNLTLRQVIIMRKSIESRVIDINRHKSKIERINATKVNKQRREREDAARYRAEGSILPTLLTQVINKRSEQARIDKEQAEINRAALLPAIQRQFASVGYDPTAPSAERAEWERLQDINRHAIPGADLSKQGDEFMQRMHQAETEREAELRQHAEKDAAIKTIDTDIDKVGSADEWSKLI